MTLAKYNTKKGSPNNRRKSKRVIDQEFIELQKMESMMDNDLKSVYLNNLSFLKDELRWDETL